MFALNQPGVLSCEGDLNEARRGADDLATRNCSSVTKERNLNQAMSTQRCAIGNADTIALGWSTSSLRIKP